MPAAFFDIFLGGSLVPRAGLSAITPAQEPCCHGLTGVTASIPHPKARYRLHVAGVGNLYKITGKHIALQRSRSP